MEFVKGVLTFLNDPMLVYRFQNLCGLERILSSSLDQNGVQCKKDSSTEKGFLKGDKGIDSIFSAVDRDSRFISQDELVKRHIQHIKEHDVTEVEPKRNNGHRDVNNPSGSHKASKHHVGSGKFYDSSRNFRINSKFLYYLFRFGSSLGYEAFYATFFPVWTWNIDGAVCRRVVVMWVLTMYIGQVLKDILKLPRPSANIVVQMEPMYVSEYGMPSTHAMVGFAVPFSLLYFSAQRYEFPFILGFTICSIWCLLICSSRIYLGMHSILDIIGGLVLVATLLSIFLPYADAIDNFQLSSPIAPIVIFVLHLIPALYYPQAHSEEILEGQWGPTWADTVTILSAGTGIVIGSWLNFQLGLVTAPALTSNGLLLPPPYPIKWPDMHELVNCILRAVVGLACLATVRIAGKTMAYLTVCRYLGKDPAEVKGKNLVKVELPVKFFTYAAIGMSATFFIPALFRGLHIARDTMYTEV